MGDPNCEKTTHFAFWANDPYIIKPFSDSIQANYFQAENRFLFSEKNDPKKARQSAVFSELTMGRKINDLGPKF